MTFSIAMSEPCVQGASDIYRRIHGQPLKEITVGIHPYWNEAVMQYNNEVPDILAIGDSWFWYPANNLLNPINNFWNGNKTILALGNNGAKAVEYTGKYKRSIRDAVRGYKTKVRAVLISGGGNDFAGQEDMDKIIRIGCADATTIDACFQPSQPDALFDSVLDAYVDLVTLIWGFIPGAKIFIHDYDYAIPGKTDWIGFGQWLKTPMNLASVPADLQQSLVNRLIDDFGSSMKAFADTNPGVTFIHSAGTLKQEDEWSNELHPTPEGFEKIAKTCWQAPLLAAIQ
jgi:hypothetical protein